MLFLLFSSLRYKIRQKGSSFYRLWTIAFVHLCLDVITVFTVNSRDMVPAGVNKTIHVFYAVTVILFVREFLLFILNQSTSEKITEYVKHITGLVAAAAFVGMFFLNINYVDGKITSYITGSMPAVAYGITGIFLICSAAVLLLQRKKTERRIFTYLILLDIFMLAAEVIQLFSTELLITGFGVTLVTLGVFLSMDNPLVTREGEIIDIFTGLLSRNTFETDYKAMEEEYRRSSRSSGWISFVFCDINGLKSVNDRFGHMVGDEYISLVVTALSDCLNSSKRIYRIGGDEFLAVYRKTGKSVIMREIGDVYTRCREMNAEYPYEVSVAMGFAHSEEENASLSEVLSAADHDMYDKKWKMKNGSVTKADNSGQELDTSGLTDRVFEAFALADYSNIIYVTNMKTNVSRWSKAGVSYFGLPGEYMYDAGTIWEEHVHTQDRERYHYDLEEVLSGRKKYHDMEYRARNARGVYVDCRCKGIVLRGRGEEPDLFAGILSSSARIEELSKQETEN